MEFEDRFEFRRFPSDRHKLGFTMAETILVISANVDASRPLRLDKELKAIRKAVDWFRDRHNFEVRDVQAATIGDLRQALLEWHPRIVHFCGHGEGDPGLRFEGDDGHPILVSSRALTNLFAEFADHVDCVVLNACYSEAQAKAIVKKIPFVIGMSDEIEDPSAIAFSEAFYEAIAAGKDIPAAHRLGKNAIELENLRGDLVPKLLRSKRREPDPHTELPTETAVSGTDSKIEQNETDGSEAPMPPARYRFPVSDPPDVPIKLAAEFADFISKNEDPRKIKEFVRANPELLDAVPQFRGGSPMIENLLDFDRSAPTRKEPGGTGPDFTRFVFQQTGSFASQIRNRILFIQFLSPRLNPFATGTKLSEPVEKAKEMIWERIKKLPSRYEEFVDKAVALDEFEIGKSILMSRMGAGLNGVIVVGRRKLLDEEQLMYLSASMDESDVKIVTYDALIEACQN